MHSGMMQRKLLKNQLIIRIPDWTWSHGTRANPELILLHTPTYQIICDSITYIYDITKCTEKSSEYLFNNMLSVSYLLPHASKEMVQMFN